MAKEPAQDKETVTPQSRAAWRAWLEKNHAAKPEIWVVFYKQHTGKSGPSYNDAVEEALCFGWIDGMKRSLDGERYMHRFSPRKPNSKWSESNIKRVERLLKSGLMTPAGQCHIDEAKESGAWADPVRPKTGFAMPDEFAARLKQNNQAQTFFDSLAPSYRRQFVDWVASAKRAETRLRRSDEAIALLNKGKKLGMR